MFFKTKLENGLRVIMVPDKSSRAVTVLVLVGTGSKYEKKETNGISHMLEHMLFKGTEKRPGPIDIVEPLDRVGGMYNAFTSEECTGYYAKVESSQFNLALDIISDIYLNSKIESKELEKERRVIIEEINMYNDHPSSYVQILWNRVLYGDQPAGRDIAGTKATVSKITRNQILSYIKSQYVASNTIICIAGNIPSRKVAVSKIKNNFSFAKKGKLILKPLVREKQNKPECLLYEKKTDQTHFCLGARGYNIFSPERYSQEVLSAVLGGMMSSRLFIKIREELSLAYYIRTSDEANTDTGFIVTQTGVDNAKAEKAIVEIMKEYKRIASELVSVSEIEKAKENIKGKMALALETSDSQASFYGLQELMLKKIRSPKEIYKKIDAVKPTDVLNLAKNIFQPKNINIAIVGPFKNKERFQRLLRI